ncbi:hypothetical protein SEA_FLOAT294_4 [Gordonia phage Float294]|uniref:Uncharacterized protein n=2 Tax=Skysandvirus TaxID=2948912 RepID=A0A385DTA6_9CAUD|nr:hypothetical protein KNU08_gp04 [Gordonia phage Skysand]YP_010103111.1 hypothetical protein KNU64_gp04 [Gordonia Phage Lollipop1437]QRI45240.1 hypothetical protein SEA_ENNEA_4 [Gordonia phage Ennea]QXN74387.1 hypothetical protein SEA_FLOAT294_4 [Gordonia phage Float294]AXQ62038.1 hypothetical protein SEA_SKYSAND_4 [Gordonia phage Skysand]QDF19108.1 hypothetical protein SEA_LOLLIPOP1437_4 [Gordonia Phage Lollipop1437]
MVTSSELALAAATLKQLRESLGKIDHGTSEGFDAVLAAMEDERKDLEEREAEQEKVLRRVRAHVANAMTPIERKITHEDQVKLFDDLVNGLLDEGLLIPYLGYDEEIVP